MPPTYSLADVTIVDFPATPVAVMTHRGDPKTLPDTLRAFVAWRRGANLPPGRHATYNIYHTDPDTTPAAENRLDICIAMAGPIPQNPIGLVAGVIPAGRCARLRVTGAPHLRAAIHDLYATWLPESGEELRDFPIFAQRVALYPDVPEHAAITDVYLPLTGTARRA